ncbi:rhomboid family intramembrane serine protease [Polaromonas sp.]|uniref:rhomboid family intramembrane serine protease n=1 Tax=Polaromonas sp. TaxID=1869339 RepID=UPI003267E58C
MVDSTGAQLREFHASWRSTTGGVTMFLVVIVLLLLAFALLGPDRKMSWILLAGAAVTAWMAWLLGRQLLGNQPALRVGPRGIRAHFLKGRKPSWNDIADVREESVQGHTHIVLSLAPGASTSLQGSRLTGKKRELRIPLAAIRKKDHGAAVQAVFEAFHRYGGTQALKAAEARIEELRAATDFEVRLREMTPVTWALYLMVALNVGVWLANVVSGVSAFKPLSLDLLRWGANSAASVVEDHQYWRLLTATFLHAGVLHIALNMFGLWEAGKQLNRLYGNVQFLMIYFASALVGSALSLHFSAQQAVSVGASGAVFGVLGALLMAMYRHRGRIPGVMSKNVMTSQAVFLVYALGQGFTKEGIDNAAHIGGLVAGSLLAWLLAGKMDETQSSRRLQATVMAGLLLPAVAVAGLVLTTPEPKVHHRQLFEFQAGLARILPDLQAAEKALQADGKAASTGKLTTAQFVQAIETRHLPAYQKVERELEPLNVPPHDRAAPLVNDIKRGNSLLVAMMQIEVTRANNPGQVDPVLEAKFKAMGEELKLIKARSSERDQIKKPGK